ncbi:MAG: hypothetical protein ACXADH_15715 [Candidatus Kariarchaeaceae archaeon]
MAQESNPDDILLTVKVPYLDYAPNIGPNYDSLLQNFVNPHIYIEHNIPISRSDFHRFIHQIWYLGFNAGLITIRNKDITEVWYGKHKDDDHHSVENKKDFIKFTLLWKLHFPVPLSFPFVHLTKQEQWDLINPKLRPYISSCSLGTNCGKCTKCDEFNRIIK